MSDLKQLGLDVATLAVYGREVQNICHARATNSGWWTNLQTNDLFDKQEILAMVPQKLMLVVSELSEAMEAHRKNLMDHKLPERHGVEVELADALIRIYDLGGALGFDLGAAMADKIKYNAHRPDHKLSARKAVGGKQY